MVHRHRIEHRAGPQRRNEAERHTDDEGEDHGGDRQLQRGPHAVVDEVDHRLTGAETGAEIELRKVRDIGHEALHQRLVQPEFLVEAGDHLRVGGAPAVGEEACGESSRYDAEDDEYKQRNDHDRGYDLQDAAQGETKHERFRSGRPVHGGGDNR
ncbi:hypothetical protein C770_GR4pC1389 (plasmid) [Sinorhizobium meliloti GR4]|nr:hypothetical protein C770_GR4pC1389 [Sinorhizobium meliloti GR4]